MALNAYPLELDPEPENALLSFVQKELSAAIEAHHGREKFLAELLQAYKAEPESSVKNFPWHGASNVVVPYVAISVDAIAARLQRALLGPKDPVEVHMFAHSPFMMQNGKELEDKDVRDWLAHFLEASGAKDRLRELLFDVALNGDGYVKPLWVEQSEQFHGYDAASGEVVEINVPGYTGVQWFVPSAADVVIPTGFDAWGQLPWFANRLFLSWNDLKQGEKDKVYKDVDRVKNRGSQRQDARHKVQQKSEKVKGDTQNIFVLYEVHGMFEIQTKEEGEEPVFQELILTYSLEANCFLRAIYNPFFGRARHFVKIPYLVQSHQLYSLGVAEMALPFQREASTAHNQVIDSATAANAGMIVCTPDSSIARNPEIHPGKKIVTENPDKDIRVVHLADASRTLADVEERAAFMLEKRTGVSIYNLGMESATVGSRATATGTTALITEGNIRFWVSIDDMRRAIEELLYLTVQQEQQFRPEGYEWAPGRYIQFPPGDPRLSVGLSLVLSSESVNRDLNVQQMQLLITVLNDYYSRVMQAGAILFNPQFPPQQKMLIASVMNSAAIIMKKFVERFDIENLDAVVPSVMSALQGMSAAMQGMQNGLPPGGPPGPQQLGIPPGTSPPPPSGMGGGGAQPPTQAVGPRGEQRGDTSPAGRSALPST